jgi:xanthine/uracil/vitamin C permease (AzgA family)
MHVYFALINLLLNAGYDKEETYVFTVRITHSYSHQLFTTGLASQASVCAVGCVIGGLVANLPFVIAPPSAISIFLSVFLQ